MLFVRFNWRSKFLQFYNMILFLNSVSFAVETSPRKTGYVMNKAVFFLYIIFEIFGKKRRYMESLKINKIFY